MTRLFENRSCRGRLRILLPVLSFCVGCCLGPGAAAAQEAEAAPGSGDSRWGTIPPESDSIKAVFTTPGRAGWEYPLLVPYWIAGSPFWLLGQGIDNTAEALANSPTATRLVAWLTRQRARFMLAPGLEAGGLPGFGLGATFRAEPFLWQGSQLAANVRWSVTGDWRSHVGVRGPLGSDGEIQFGAGLRIRPNARFFGVGPDTRLGNQSFFQSEEGWAGVGLGWSLGRGFHVEADTYWSRVGAFPTDDEAPALENVFQELPRGFGRFSDGVSFGAALIHDDAPRNGRPNRGGSRRLKASYLRSLDDESSNLWYYRAEVQQFSSLLREHQVLALRGFISWVDPAGSGRIPFQRLVTTADRDLMRGFEDFRFRDRGLVVLTAEYRWPLWVYSEVDGVGVDVYLLADWGQVFDRVQDIDPDRFQESYGFGFRLLGYDGFLGRLEFARSDEEWVVRLRGDQVFQFARAGLFHGRSRVPNR